MATSIALTTQQAEAAAALLFDLSAKGRTKQEIADIIHVAFCLRALASHSIGSLKRQDPS